MWVNRPLYAVKVRNLSDFTVVLANVAIDQDQESVVEFYSAEDLRQGWSAHLRGVVLFTANPDGSVPFKPPTDSELRGEFTLDVLDDVETEGVADGQGLIHDETSNTWIPGDVGGGGGGSVHAGLGLVKTGGHTLSIDTTIVTRKEVGFVPSGSQSVTINHSLNTKDVFVSVREVSRDELVLVDVVSTSTTSITLNFKSIPTSEQYRYIIMG